MLKDKCAIAPSLGSPAFLSATFLFFSGSRPSQKEGILFIILFLSEWGIMDSPILIYKSYGGIEGVYLYVLRVRYVTDVPS